MASAVSAASAAVAEGDVTGTVRAGRARGKFSRATTVQRFSDGLRIGKNTHCKKIFRRTVTTARG